MALRPVEALDIVEKLPDVGADEYRTHGLFLRPIVIPAKAEPR
jgi:hypothetical protein